MSGKGQGMPQDDKASVNWYRKAAEQGDGDAQFILGYMYAQGRGVPRNDAEALRWYKRAADQGSDLSQTSLGLMYYEGSGLHEGHGVQQNYVLAHMWYNLAAKQGNQDAINNLKLVAQLMSPAQIAEALRFASNWKSKRAFSDAEIGLLPDVSAPKQSVPSWDSLPDAPQSRPR
jgi:TPR repeat protein